MNIFFSFIIPVFNSEKYIYQCVNSILNQKRKNIEIILINDYSTDKSLKICNFLEKTNKSIKVIHHKKNLGVAQSRNDGIRASGGKYLIFLDSDDYLQKKSHVDYPHLKQILLRFFYHQYY